MPSLIVKRVYVLNQLEMPVITMAVDIDAEF
jgi:hypothetical protein